MDKLSAEQRHRNMAAIHAADTKPEMIVRKYLFAHGFRYRLNHRRLPGRPDIVLRRYRTCIFVNGCFWHGHEECRYFRLPKSNTEFWKAKISRNIQRDKRVQRELAAMGWHCITVWECELKPKVRERTLASLEFTLNRIFLEDRMKRTAGSLSCHTESRQEEGVEENIPIRPDGQALLLAGRMAPERHVTEPRRYAIIDDDGIRMAAEPQPE